MTILGKILVFLVLVLSIVWNALVVNAYVTRTNWQAEAKRAHAKAKEAADSANEMKKLLDEERAAAEEAKRAYRAELERQYSQVAQLLKDRADLNQQIHTAFEQAKGQGAQAGVQQTNVEKLQQQVDNLDRLIQEKQQQLTDLTLQAQQDRVAAEQARIDAAAVRQQNDRLAARVQQLNSELEEYRRTHGALRQRGPGEQLAAPVPEGFRGTVTRTEGTAQDLRAGRDVWVEFKPGLDAGVRPGAVVTVFRRNNGTDARYLGTIRVERADAKDSVGRFTPARPARAVGPDDLPKPGDELIPNTAGTR
jgi:multidrug efflux pump subunit AcrA (membrane-fusion protein)